MSTKLYGTYKGSTVYSATQIQLLMDGGYRDATNSQAVMQSGFNLMVTQPSTITALLFEEAIADALKNFFNSTFGTSFVRSDVILVDGAVTLFSVWGDGCSKLR